MSNEEPEKESRTDLAEDRTVLANERTFAGWMRTGMAAVALALGLRALFGPFEPAWVPKLAATALIAVALFIFWAAWRSTRRTLDRLEDHVASGQTKRRLASISGALALAAVTTGVVLWFL
jgi:putative membrane protein